MTKEIKDSELVQRLAELSIESLTDAVFWLDSKARVHRVNKAACDSLGYTRDELLGMTAFDINPDFHEEMWPEFWNKIQKEKSFYMETRHQTKDGHVFPVGGNVNFIEFGGNEYLCGFARDITERKKIEEALHVSEKKFRGLIEGSVQGICVHKEDFKVLYANDSMAKILGYDNEEEIIGLDLLKEVIFEGEREQNIAHYYSVLRGDPIENPIEKRGRLKDGSIFWVERIHTAIEWDGEPALLATATDITKRKSAEEALLKAMEEVENLKNRLQAENIYLKEEIQTEHNFEDIITGSDLLKKVLRKVEQVASTDATVLITGETGTGKELLARAVHNLSGRRDRPLVKVNCAALPANLIESELFGHEKGAFTGALSRKIGRFELANGGTIFLDEIGDLHQDLQAKLLRVLQEGEFERLGSSDTIKVDVRIIAATNRNLDEAIVKNEFREDLFYRLSVFPIESPPLRKRKEDIPLLVKHFVKRYSKKMGKKIDKIQKKVMAQFINYEWPGNVRELENVIERAIIVSSRGQLELGDSLSKAKDRQIVREISTLKDAERDYILDALESRGWRVSGERGAAKLLGLKPSTLESKMKKLGVKRP